MEPPGKRAKQTTTAKAVEASDSSSEEEEVQLSVDEDGRVALYGGTPPNYNFQAFKLLSLGEEALAALRKDCETAFTARTMKTGERYSRGETFWVPASANPSSALEKLALAIFWLHAGEAGYDAARSGAEWWTLAIDAGDDVGWHWDRDYGLESDTGYRIHPHLATVTYLSDTGAPTVVLEVAEGPGADSPQSMPARVAHLSRGATGKHISFDGRWLHAAPLDLKKAMRAEMAKAGEGKRITFLVNMWLNHVPISAAAFTNPDSLSPTTGPAGSILPLTPGGRVAVAPAQCECGTSAASSSNSGIQDFEWRFGAEGGDNSQEEEEAESEEEKADVDSDDEKEGKSLGWCLRLPLPVKKLQQIEEDTVTVNLAEGIAVVERMVASEAEVRQGKESQS